MNINLYQVKDYISNFGKTNLAQTLAHAVKIGLSKSSDIIIVSSGRISDKKTSNFQKLLKACNSETYFIGGRTQKSSYANIFAIEITNSFTRIYRSGLFIIFEWAEDEQTLIQCDDTNIDEVEE